MHLHASTLADARDELVTRSLFPSAPGRGMGRSYRTAGWEVKCLKYATPKDGEYQTIGREGKPAQLRNSELFCIERADPLACPQVVNHYPLHDGSRVEAQDLVRDTFAHSDGNRKSSASKRECKALRDWVLLVAENCA